MTQAAQQHTQVSKYLEKIVAAVQEAVDSGETLPWRSSHFLINMRRCLNPFRTKDFNGIEIPDGTPYRGMINPLILSLAARGAAKRRGVMDNRFVPFSTMKDLYNKGARILSNPCDKDQKDSLNDYVVVQVFFPKTVTKEVPTSDSETEQETEENATTKIQVPTGRYGLGRVVNVADTNLVEVGLLPPLESYRVQDNPPIEELEGIIARFPHAHKASMDTPHYSLTTKIITTPPLDKARSPLAHYGTYLHEVAHLIGDMLGELEPTRDIERYSEEELVAEMTRTYVLGSLGFTEDDSPEETNTVAYIRSWLSRLNDDPEMLLRAASKAKRRGEFILQGEVPRHVIKNSEAFPFLKNSPSLAA